MGFNLSSSGLDKISDMLNKLGEDAQKVAAQGLFEGAGKMADEIGKKVSAIRTAPFKYASRGATREPSPEEKQILTEHGAGISKFDKNGSEVGTSSGFSGTGYADAGFGRRAVAQIANAINSGTSFMVKQPFIRQAARSGKKAAEDAIVNKIDALCEEIIKEES